MIRHSGVHGVPLTKKKIELNISHIAEELGTNMPSQLIPQNFRLPNSRILLIIFIGESAIHPNYTQR